MADQLALFQQSRVEDISRKEVTRAYTITGSHIQPYGEPNVATVQQTVTDTKKPLSDKDDKQSPTYQPFFHVHLSPGLALTDNHSRYYTAKTGQLKQTSCDHWKRPYTAHTFRTTVPPPDAARPNKGPRRLSKYSIDNIDEAIAACHDRVKDTVEAHLRKRRNNAPKGTKKITGVIVGEPYLDTDANRTTTAILAPTLTLYGENRAR